MTDPAWRAGTAILPLEVSYRYRDGDPSHPLVVGLHGWSESEAVTARRLDGLGSLPVRLLWPRAPYPVEVRRGNRTRIGYGWYQYDGNRKRFRESLDRSASFLLELLDRVGVARRGAVLVGFSQGAYLAYFVALRHPDRFRGVVGIAGRAVHELFDGDGDLDRARHVRLLHLHGRDDELVKPEPCEASIRHFADLGFDARAERLDGGHDVSEDMVKEIQTWLGQGMV
jgi:phospholipase/carboxylesterase